MIEQHSSCRLLERHRQADLLNCAFVCMNLPVAGLQNEVMAALKETGTPHKRGTKGQANVKGSSMNNILIKRFEEMDWDNNGKGAPCCFTDHGE